MPEEVDNKGENSGSMDDLEKRMEELFIKGQEMNMDLQEATQEEKNANAQAKMFQT